VKQIRRTSHFAQDFCINLRIGAELSFGGFAALLPAATSHESNETGDCCSPHVTNQRLRPS
jgi:hypothetical protein